jgi:TRAP-type uncharacterized transport system substrate-binding protein
MKSEVFMKKLSVVLSIAAALSVMSVSAQELTISTGREGGSYFGVQGPKIVKFIKGTGLDTTFVASTGSLDNLDKVAKGEAQVGIAQADAIMFFKKTKPQAGTKIEVGGTLGRECAFVVSKKGGKVSTDADLQNKGVTIAAGAQGDGSRATWDYMGILEEKFKNATPNDVGGASGLAQVVSGQTNAFLFVTNPDPKVLYTNELFILARDNKSLQFVPVTDWDLNDKLPNGDAVYTFDKVVTKPGTFSDDKVETICMNTYTIYNSDLSPAVKEKLARAFLRMSAAE